MWEVRGGGPSGPGDLPGLAFLHCLLQIASRERRQDAEAPGLSVPRGRSSDRRSDLRAFGFCPAAVCK
eukprot:12002653-Alexandrium_andersonii.AAC.1